MVASGLRTRIMPNGSIIIINTVITSTLLVAFKTTRRLDVETKMRWDVVSIPAWLDEKSSKLLGLPEGKLFS